MELYCGDCLDVMNRISTKVDMVFCDLPYGVTARNAWDEVIPFADLWSAYSRLVKENGAMVFTATQPFTSRLIMSKPEIFKYSWVWDKVNKFSGHLNCKKQPMRITEDVLVFYTSQPTYNPQMIQGKPYKAISSGAKSSNYGAQKDKVTTVSDGTFYPRNLIAIPGDERGTVGRIHPTQKPVALMEYMVRTYTNAGDTVLDNCMGSGTTGVACVKTGRNFIGIEKDEKYFEIAKKRIESTEIF